MTPVKAQRDALRRIISGQEAGPGRLTSEQEDAFGEWESGPWPFLVGKWPLDTGTGQKGGRAPEPLFWTNDTFEGRPRPFPDYEYLRFAVVEPIFLWHGADLEKLRFVLDKPRQVLATTGILAGITWEILFRQSKQWLIAKNKREEASDLVDEKMRYAYDRLPLWLRRYRPVRPIPVGRFRCKGQGSVAKAVGQNFGRSEAKGSTADVFIDEAVLLTNLRAAWEAAHAMARRIVAVATPPEDGQVNPESVLFFRELLEGRPAGELTNVVVREDPGDSDEVLDNEEAEELLGVVVH